MAVYLIVSTVIYFVMKAELPSIDLIVLISSVVIAIE